MPKSNFVICALYFKGYYIKFKYYIVSTQLLFFIIDINFRNVGTLNYEYNNWTIVRHVQQPTDERF